MLKDSHYCRCQNGAELNWLLYETGSSKDKILLNMQFMLRLVNVDIPGVTLIGGPQQFAIVGKIKKLLCEYDAMPPVSEVQWIKDGDVIARNSSLLVNESRISVPHYNESQIQLLISQSTSQDAGNYSCLVINAVGNSFQRTSVISQGTVCYKALYNYVCLFLFGHGKFKLVEQWGSHFS